MRFPSFIVTWFRLRFGIEAALTHWKVVGGMPRFVRDEELMAAYGAGWGAAATNAPIPPELSRHTVLARAWREGLEAEKENLSEEQREQDWRDQQATYAAIDRDEMDGLLEECIDIGLINPEGRVLSSC